eukprot:scaffold126974_cov32-Tisochrysis_lutea.AAC.1
MLANHRACARAQRASVPICGSKSQLLAVVFAVSHPSLIGSDASARCSFQIPLHSASILFCASGAMWCVIACGCLAFDDIRP